MQTALNQELKTVTRILVVGSGGRENALAWALQKSRDVNKVFVAPGNGGTSTIQGCERLNIEEINSKKIIEACEANQIDFVVIGPEAPLASGLANKLREKGIVVFGPNSDGAQLEASKRWAKDLMNRAQVPTAKHWFITNEKDGLLILKKLNTPLVVKADGLASGKGVCVPETIEETAVAINKAFSGRFGKAGQKVVLEERLKGPEVSIFALCDGKRIILLPTAQDHKRLKDGDNGPNTGGMGAYSPAPLLDEIALKEINDSILEPTLSALIERNIDYRGVIYAGLMITKEGPKVIEFNCRFGDPECQTLMPLLGPELAQILYACAIGRLDMAPKLTVHELCSACVVVAASGYPESPKRGDQIRSEITSSSSIQLFYAGAEALSSGELVTSGGRVLSVATQAKNFDEAFKLAYEEIRKIKFEGMMYRKDIGYQVRSS